MPQIGFDVTEEQIALIRAAAASVNARTGFTQSAWLRAVALEAARGEMTQVEKVPVAQRHVPTQPLGIEDPVSCADCGRAASQDVEVAGRVVPMCTGCAAGARQDKYDAEARGE